MAGFPERVELGRSGLRSSPIGLGSSYGLDRAGVNAAFERGINLLYWGSLRRRSFGEGIRDVCARARDEALVVVQSYTRVPALMRRSLERALRRLALERADVLLLGWWNRPVAPRVLEAAAALKAAGLARTLMVSCHHRPAFAAHFAEPALDHVMVRYNAAHPGAEREVFPLAAGAKGVVAYTATSWGNLVDPKRTPPGELTPDAADCYRFALSQPAVDVCLAGPRDARELEAVFEALSRGPLSPDEDLRLRRVGDAVHASERRVLPWVTVPGGSDRRLDA